MFLCCFLVTASIFAQHIDQGYYNDFDFGPHGVYGNLKLGKVTGRGYYEIKKTSDSTVRSNQMNPSGITQSTYLITFKNGLISHIEKLNAWGTVVEYRKYEMIDENVFKLTFLSNGVNIFLPCKYAIETYNRELLVKTTFHSFSGRLMENENGVAIIEYKRYDDKIRFAEIMEESYFNAGNLPVVSREAGFHTIKYKFDESDNKISETYFGVSDQPVTNRYGAVYKAEFYYDANNNCTKTEYKGLQDQLAALPTGVAAISRDYLNGYEVKMTRKDSLDRPSRTGDAGDGISIIKREYDKAGNKITESFYDEYEKPMKSYRRVHKSVYQYSLQNMLTKTAYFDEKSDPAENFDQIHITRSVNDRNGRIIQESYFNNADSPTLEIHSKTYMLKYAYDDSGRNTSISYWKDNLTPMQRWNGVYETQNEYDEDGQLTGYRFLDTAKNLMRSNDGYSVCKILRDQSGIIYARQFLHDNDLTFKTDGVTSGYAVIRYEYDSTGKTIQLLFYGTEHEAVNAHIDVDSALQAHRIKFIYKGNWVVEQWYYSMNEDQPYFKLDCLKNDFLGTSGVTIGRKKTN